MGKMCQVCEKELSVYWCHDCQRSRCQNCNNQHRKSRFTKHHIVQHVQDMYTLDYNIIKINEEVNDIKVLHDELLVFINYRNLVTCHISGQQPQIIPFSTMYVPRCIAVVDKNTVAFISRLLCIVDVSRRQVNEITDVNGCCSGIIYRDNQLFVGFDDNTIKVMNMSGEVTRTIPVDKRPYYICGGEAGRIYYTDFVKLYFVDTIGNALFTFTDPEMTEPCGITTDDEGHVLVICKQSNNALRISPDGKQCEVIITQLPLGNGSTNPCICYNSLSKAVVIGICNNVYHYKNVLTPESDHVVYSTYL